MDIPTPIAVKALPNYRIWLRYSDGAEGEVDFSHLAGKGVFKLWDDYQNFERVHISDAGAIAWSDVVEICPDATYMRLTGKSVDEAAAAYKIPEDTLLVTAHQTLVYVDLEERKALLVPDDYRAKVVELEGDDVEH